MNMKAILCLAALSLTTCVRAGDEVKRLTPEQMAAMTEAKSFTASNGLTLGYRQHLPKDLTKKHPLLVLMHGVGEVGNDNFKQLHNAAPFILGYIAEGTGHEMVFLAPQCPAGHKWMEESVWEKKSHTFTPEPKKPIAAAIELIEHAIKTLPVDPDRVYIAGLSMGGFATWDILIRRPDLFAAAMPVCGGGDPASVTPALKSLPIWVTHAVNDTCVSPGYARGMVEAFWKMNAANVRYTEFHEGGHWVWDPTFRDRRFLNWLLKQNRQKKPADKVFTR